jgi:uncharacterized protein (TIGR00661 family)
MKILYAVQATGNGHISRAMELIPYLRKYASVDVFLSGANSSLPMDGAVKFRSKGLCLYYNDRGSLHYGRMLTQFAPLRIAREIRDLPVEKYDLVLNDFECITALACAYKKVPSVNFGHQASFQSLKTPRPARKDFIGEWILKNYARATQYVGLHYQAYDDFILPPVIKQEILRAEPLNKGHITVYLPAFCDASLISQFAKFKDFQFQLFSKEITAGYKSGNISLLPVNKESFNKSLINCKGIITGAGFETPAEALFLGKKLMCIPIKGQYEQLCNAAALENMGICCLDSIDEHFAGQFNKWINLDEKIMLAPDHSTESIVSFLMHVCTHREKYCLDPIYPELVF